MHDSLLALAPLGTPTTTASRAIEATGFQCEPLRRGTFGTRDTIAFAHCDLSISQGAPISRRWQVALVDSVGALAEIRVATGLIGP
jgi:hypothetical protein